MQTPALKYRSGEEIRKGDCVLFHGNSAQVDLLASDPDDPEAAWHMKEFGGGGVDPRPQGLGPYFHPERSTR
jgi:hypothetical protein